MIAGRFFEQKEEICEENFSFSAGKEKMGNLRENLAGIFLQIYEKIKGLCQSVFEKSARIKGQGSCLKMKIQALIKPPIDVYWWLKSDPYPMECTSFPNIMYV